MGANNQGQQKVITWKELSQYNTKKKCWIMIGNRVYDVTNFQDEHPGGASTLLKYAGSDATDAFGAVEGHANIKMESFKQYYVGDIEPKPQPEKYKIKSRKYNWQQWSYTKEDIDKMIKEQDRIICIIEDVVVDVTDFAKSHPGGEEILKSKNGTDITLEFKKEPSHPNIDNLNNRIGKFKKQ